MSTPEMSLLEAQKEISKFGEVVTRMNGFVKGLVAENLESKQISKTLARIKKYEDITDRIEQDVADYLTKVSQNEMTEETSKKLSVEGFHEDLQSESLLGWRSSRRRAPK